MYNLAKPRFWSVLVLLLRLPPSQCQGWCAAAAGAAGDEEWHPAKAAAARNQ